MIYKKIVHIHTDKKFIDISTVFEGAIFNNEIIWIADGIENYEGFYQNKIIRISKSSSTVEKVVENCQQADLVILYDLDSLKTKIALSLPDSIKIGWRFFGYELYNINRNCFFSELTKKTFLENKNFWQLVVEKIKDKRLIVFSIFYPKLALPKSFRAAIKKCDYFFGVVDSEYKALTNYWGKLPTFIQWPIRNIFSDEYYDDDNIKTTTVIVGNSRNCWNNHLDVLETIQSNSNSKYNFILPFNYGDKDNYFLTTRQKAMSIKNVQLLDSFLDFSDFRKIFISSTASFYNSYRQLALGNIFLALGHGVKLYLNRKNPTFEWLKREGFLVFDENNFKEDLKNSNLALNKNDAQTNRKRCAEISSPVNLTIFQKEVEKRFHITSTIASKT